MAKVTQRPDGTWAGQIWDQDGNGFRNFTGSSKEEVVFKMQDLPTEKEPSKKKTVEVLIPKNRTYQSGTINKNIDMIRGGMTKTELEEKCGLGKGSIRKWDDHAPDVWKVYAVAKFFNVPIECILTELSETDPETELYRSAVINKVKAMGKDELKAMLAFGSAGAEIIKYLKEELNGNSSETPVR